MADGFTNRDKARCAARELGHRRKVYRHLVERQGMPQEKADREIAMMEAIRADYERLAEVDEKGAKLL